MAKQTGQKFSEKPTSGHIASGVENCDITSVPGRAKVYRVRYTLPAIRGRKRQVTRTVEGLANARKLAQELANNSAALAESAGKKRGSKSMTLAEALEKYLRAGKGSWAPKTWITKKERLNRYLVPAVGANTDIKTITPLQLQALQDGIQERGLAPMTCKQVMLTVRALFSQLLAWKAIDENPCAALTTIKAKCKAKEIWAPAEVKSVLCSEACPLWLRLLLVAGLRPEELQALTWKGINLERGGIQVNQVAYFETDRKEWKIREGAKTKTSERFIPLDNFTLTVLAEAKAKGKGAGLVVTAPRGGIVSLSTLRRWLDEYAQSNGLPRIPLYALRHSSITFLLENGVMVKTVAARAGHSNTATTLAHYATVTDSAARAAAEAFEVR